jgi:hypothetical protein
MTTARKAGARSGDANDFRHHRADAGTHQPAHGVDIRGRQRHGERHVAVERPGRGDGIVDWPRDGRQPRHRHHHGHGIRRNRPHVGHDPGARRRHDYRLPEHYGTGPVRRGERPARPWLLPESLGCLAANTFRITGTGLGEAIFLQNGSGNRVRQNTITGGYDGSSKAVGTDDGIVLESEAGDTVEGNTISDVYDTAVEGDSGLANTTIWGNTFSNTGWAAIGAYWCTDWTNNIVANNQASGAPQFAAIHYNVGNLCGTTTPEVFTGNRFIGNVFRNAAAGRTKLTQAALSIIFHAGTIAGNVIQGNDFGSYDGPYVLPLSGFTDGGGNVCGPLNPALSNFACSGGG